MKSYSGASSQQEQMLNRCKETKKAGLKDIPTFLLSQLNTEPHPKCRPFSEGLL